ncbi:hypothetical protein GGX14DRAFT_354323 [Mycena pura]|uniref:CxC6 like cysteine cluster associated with KDZ domain-containing protein n=1 Tax=Mycena pura TaxID=153505 RepID=A0AAD6VWX3_9AGAR|nr:hypothetical protein GGX14DRAFT_354323 [Mycena pura]
MKTLLFALLLVPQLGDCHSSGAETISPPVTVCLQPSCHSHKLGEPSIVESRLYTLKRGILPVFSKSLYCRKCYTRYYHNYSVQNASDPASQRVYYTTDIPEIIHVTESCFVERKLCVYFETQMAVSHAPSQAIAQVYNLALGQSDIPNASRLIHHLTGEVVLDSFLFHAILRDKHKRREVLSIPHASYQNHRLDQALLERNYRMAGTGQDMWAHACDKCMKVYQGNDQRWYRMTAGVHDGVTVRHVCCSVHNCAESLLSQRDHFCQSHRHLAKECCVDDCTLRAEPGHRTCGLQSHRDFEVQAELRNTAMFQLHSRLRNAALSNPPSTPIKGRTSRSWTHNEQLFVRCCGVIISRATFFGAEGITGVKDFLKATFPEEYPGSMPSYIFYDNNCQLLKHLRSCGDHYFDNVGLPVDVFHFKCKHTQADIFCQLNCNPALFKELIGPNGEWIFNSSAAEQANVWFGKFQNIVQEMPALRFNFFLDEMIAIHNRFTVAELTRSRHRPHLQEEDLLRGLHM